MWVAVATVALGSGILVGWAIEDVPLESLTVGDWLRSLTMVALCGLAPLLGAAALMRRDAVPGFAALLGAPAECPVSPWVRVLGFTWIVLSVIAVQVALGLVFDPRYKDFPFAPLTGATIPFVVLAWSAAPGAGTRGPVRRGIAETAFAMLLGGCAVYIALNEGFANWQALWLAGAFLVLAVTLVWRRGGPAPA
jgi:glucan 1,3-beta-glucosidase